MRGGFRFLFSEKVFFWDTLMCTVQRADISDPFLERPLPLFLTLATWEFVKPWPHFEHLGSYKGARQEICFDLIPLHNQQWESGFCFQNDRVVQLRFSRKRFLGEFVLAGGGVGAAAGAPGASERRRQAGGHLHHLHQSNHQGFQQSNHQTLTGEPVTPQPSRWAEYIFLMSINNEKEWLLCNIQDLVIYAFDFKWFIRFNLCLKNLDSCYGFPRCSWFFSQNVSTDQFTSQRWRRGVPSKYIAAPC